MLFPNTFENEMLQRQFCDPAWTDTTFGMLPYPVIGRFDRHNPAAKLEHTLQFVIVIFWLRKSREYPRL